MQIGRSTREECGQRRSMGGDALSHPLAEATDASSGGRGSEVARVAGEAGDEVMQASRAALSSSALKHPVKRCCGRCCICSWGKAPTRSREGGASCAPHPALSQGARCGSGSACSHRRVAEMGVGLAMHRTQQPTAAQGTALPHRLAHLRGSRMSPPGGLRRVSASIRGLRGCQEGRE